MTYLRFSIEKLLELKERPGYLCSPIELWLGFLMKEDLLPKLSWSLYTIGPNLPVEPVFGLSGFLVSQSHLSLWDWGNRVIYLGWTTACAHKTDLPKIRCSEWREPPKWTKIWLHLELTKNDDMDIKLTLSPSPTSICQHLSCIPRPLQRLSTSWLASGSRNAILARTRSVQLVTASPTRPEHLIFCKSVLYVTPWHNPN